MAKSVTKKSAAPAKRKSAARRPARKPASAAATAKKQPARATTTETGMSASDALFGLLESPLVADVLAAGAAAALASFTHHRLTRRRDSNSKQALKDAAKAAATAMGARLSEELDEILESSKKTKRARR
jgi:hypothetical protein